MRDCVDILPAAPEHADEIARLAGIVWRADYPGIISPEQIEYMLQTRYDPTVVRREMAEGVRYVGFLDGGEFLGFASYGPSGNEVKLHKLYVHPDHQRRGLGSALIRHVENASHGRTLMLTVNKRNEKAISAYRKNGFAVRDSIVVDIGNGFVMDDYVMAKAVPV